MLIRLFLFVFAASSIVSASNSQADDMMKQSASPTLQVVSIADDGSLKLPLTRIQAITETRSYRVNVTKNHSEYRKNNSGGVEIADVPYQVETESLVEVKIPVFEQIEWSVSADKYRGFDTKGNALSADQLKTRFKTPAPAVVCPVGSVVPIALLPLLSDTATILTLDDFEPGVIKENSTEPPPAAPAPATQGSIVSTPRVFAVAWRSASDGNTSCLANEIFESLLQLIEDKKEDPKLRTEALMECSKIVQYAPDRCKPFSMVLVKVLAERDGDLELRKTAIEVGAKLVNPSR